MSVDTNVLVYVLDDYDPAKQETARKVVATLMAADALLGLQCVGEFQAVLRRKLRVAPWEAAQEARNLLTSFATFPSTETACLAALGGLAAGRSAYWDTLLVHSAADAGCSVLFTEDVQGAPAVGGVEIVNPFAADGQLSDRARALLSL